MKLYKAKIDSTVVGETMKLLSDYEEGYCITVQSVSYSNDNPQEYIHIYDADGDEFMFGIPGQALPKPTTPEIAITVKLPLYAMDEGNDNSLTIWGEVYKVNPELETSF